MRKNKNTGEFKDKILQSKWWGEMAPNGHVNVGVASVQTGYRI